MKRLLCVCLLMFGLSLPAFAGHTLPGDNASYCDCATPGCIEDYPGECGVRGLPSNQTPTDDTAKWGIALVAVLLWLRLKA